MKYLIITDIPAPWREKVYEIVYNDLGNNFHVVYCSINEKRRLWKFSHGSHPRTILNSISFTIKNRGERFFNLGIFPFLFKNRPKYVICFGIFPTIFVSYFLLKLLKSKIATLSDSWIGRESGISIDQIWARKIIYKYFSDAFIGASRQTLSMYKFYNNNISSRQMFLSHLCADNDFFKSKIGNIESHSRKYDIMFSGRIVETKNPLFFAEVAIKIKKRLGKCRVLIIGDGDRPIKNAIFKSLEENNIEYDFPGFIEHRDLPDYYIQSKLLLLPTSGDCWGVVINEAFASGVPVLTTELTAAAGELVIDGENGFILPLDPDLWADKACQLLRSFDLLQSFSGQAKRSVEPFNFYNAAQGLISCFKYLEKN